MRTITQNAIKLLKEVGQDISVLLVEDDEDLSLQFQSLIYHFFNRVDMASNGKEALEIYKNNKYDLVITDLTMPVMCGSKLASALREKDMYQYIFVMSAHSDSSKLIELINIGIDGFILKPLNVDSVMTQLAKVCQSIYEHKMLQHLNNMLEDANKELRVSNNRLEKSVQELKNFKQASTIVIDTTIAAMPSEAKAEVMRPTFYTKSEKMSAIDFFEVYPFELEKTNEDLEILEDRFNIILNKAGKKVDEQVFMELVDILRYYSHAIELIPQFSTLAYGIKELVVAFEAINDMSKIEAAMPMLTFLFDNLDRWRRGIFLDQNVDDIHYMDDSLISDVISLQNFLNNTNVVEETEMEFF